MTDETETYKGFLVRNFRQKVGDVINECRTHSLSEDSRIHIKDTLVIGFSKALDSYRLETIKEVEEGFIGEFCNDHNAKIRWLRGVALDMNHLLEQILDYLAHLKGGEKK
jgi:hypothetical protein